MLLDIILVILGIYSHTSFGLLVSTERHGNYRNDRFSKGYYNFCD